MKIINKPKSLFMVLLTSLAFNANAILNVNSIGDDGNPNTVGNAGAKKSNAKSVNNGQILFNVNNQSSAAISKIVVVNNKDKQLYSGKFNCKVDQRCDLNLGKVEWQGTVYLKFYDAKNNLASAYQLLDKPSSGTNYIMINDAWLGVYVFNQLQQKSGKPAMKLNEELTSFFINYSSPDNTPDIFEELGLYFVAQKVGANENKFYKDFLVKLAHDKVLNSETARGPMVKSVAMPFPSGKGICDDAAKAQSIFSYMGSVIGMIPVVGGVVGGFFSIGSQIVGDACPSGTDAKLAEINNKVEMLDSKINALDYQIDALASKLSKADAQKAINSLTDRNRYNYNFYVAKYVSFTNNYQTILNYVQNNGGLRSAFEKSDNAKYLLQNLTAQLNQFEGLLTNQNIKDLKISLDEWCNKDPKQITGDVIANRIQCDIVINKAVTTVIASSMQFKPMLKDEINTIVEAKKAKTIDKAWLIDNLAESFTYLPDGVGSKSISVPWEQAAAKVDEIIDAKVKFLSDTLLGANKDQLYVPLAGFPEELAKGMIAAGCSSLSTDGKTVMPAVLEWYARTSDNKPYIVTQCKNGNELVKSKYYYQKRGATEVDGKVVNVIGVLVPDRFFHGGTGNNYGDGSAFPWANYSLLQDTSGSGVFDDVSVSAGLRAPDSTLAAGFGFSPADLNKLVIPAGGFTEKFTRNSKSYIRSIFNRSILTNGGDWAFGITYYGADYWQIGSGEFFSFMRYVNSDGTSYVWAIRSKIDKADKRLQLWLTPQCITNDCKAIDTGAKMDELQFSSGPKVNWVASTYGGSGTYVLSVDGKPMLKN
ncbi:hypothetical protein [Aquella oligotrophica]|uniref:Uncharacterized protein n=1 Tax=Aquella oligotrophica TaxID=2067065 RepID=A0A2I7N8Q4_9NEIS|nr:hypothetical protein [Aquella oligotrophica]AUR52822.1 hypothetical protein CUN60_11125 [Aquella oligotrophica]